MFQGKGKNAGKTLNEHTKEELIQMVCHLKECKKFGLVWEDKPEQVAKDCQEKLPILREDKIKALTLDNEQPTNITIEGDNYHALSVLNYTHAGKIDVIYIDPPYNTGNKDFVYNDKIVDTEDSYRHSKWLSFMEKRLRLAKNLLTPDGVIFISIDDNEQAYLKVLCDEIFGPENFITNFVWEKTQHFGRQKLNTYNNADYILCYAKNKFSDKIKELLVEEIKTDLLDAPLYNASNNVHKLTFKPGVVKFNIPDGIYNNSTSNDYVLEGPVRVKKGKNSNEFSLSFRSRWSQRTVEEEIEKGTSFWVKTENFAIRAIYSADKSTKVAPKQILFTNLKNPHCAHSRFDVKVGTNESATSQVADILGNNIFSYPKPASLVSYLITLIFNEKQERFRDDLMVLDFFAGSGTTGQAVLELNKADGGKRQFILCTNNENKIAEDVTYPRIKTVITGNRPDGTKYSDGIPSNVRYFKTDFVSKNKTSDRLRREIAPLCTDMIKIRENCFESVIDTEQLKVLRNNRGLVALVFDDGDLGDYIRQIDAIPTDAPVYLYVFSYNSDNRHYEIPDDASHEYISQPIPEGVLSVYRRIFQPKDK